MKEDQHAIFVLALEQLPESWPVLHVSGGMPLTKSDVDLALRHPHPENLLSSMPTGTTKKLTPYGIQYTFFLRGMEVNLMASTSWKIYQSYAHRKVVQFLVENHPLANLAWNHRNSGEKPEPIWADLLGLKGCPYQAIAKLRNYRFAFSVIADKSNPTPKAKTTRDLP